MKKSKRNLLIGSASAAVLGALVAGGLWWHSQQPSQSSQSTTARTEQTIAEPLAARRVSENERHYIFDLNENVTREHVYYTNRYGVEIAADIYYPKDMDKSQQHAALVVGPPFGGVKEQGPGVYANELAQRGFVVVAFDPAYHGYSGGQPRYTGSPETYVEDFSAAVDYLGTLDYVNRDQIGALGICASGAFSLGAAAQDTRIKAVATSVLYDIPGLAGSATGDARREQLDAIGQQRWEDAENGTAAYRENYPSSPQDSIPEGLDETAAEFNEFYATSRGWHENALSNITDTSNPSFMNFQVTNHINEISAPILMVTSEQAHSRAFTEGIYDMFENKDNVEMYVAPRGRHIDFYDNTGNVIPFDRFADFFNNALGVK